MSALRLLFSVPRAYLPLVEAWEEKFPGTKRSIDKLVLMGFVEYQPGVIIDTRTGKPADTAGPPLPRYKANARGRRLSQSAAQDLRVLKDSFPRLTDTQAPRLAAFIGAFNVDATQGRFGVSVPHASSVSGLPERSARWWVRRLVDEKYLVELPFHLPDRREVIPAHWRVTRMLCRQVSDLVDAFPVTASPSLRVEFRLARTRFLDDVDPARVGVTGATDFDHDVETQRVLAALFTSPKALPGGVFTVEPRLSLPVLQTVRPWEFRETSSGSVFYQPDAEMREVSDTGQVPRKSIIEYERFQTRRDGWSHIERFLGWVHATSLPFEPAVLRFVVDSDPRVRSYVELIESFADYSMDHIDRLPVNAVTLAVSSVGRLLESEDPLDPSAWFRINLPTSEGSDNDRVPVLHDPEDSPYSEYFTRD